jgi:hypothetical protein
VYVGLWLGLAAVAAAQAALPGAAGEPQRYMRTLGFGEGEIAPASSG